MMNALTTIHGEPRTYLSKFFYYYLLLYENRVKLKDIKDQETINDIVNYYNANIDSIKNPIIDNKKNIIKKLLGENNDVRPITDTKIKFIYTTICGKLKPKNIRHKYRNT